MAGNKSRTSYGSKSGEFMAALHKREETIAGLVTDMRKDPFVVLVERVLTSNMKSAQVTVSTSSQDRRTRVLAYVSTPPAPITPP